MKTPLILVSLAAAFTALASATPPPAAAMLEAMKVSAASSSFASDIQLAQTEAIRRNRRVVLCPSADGASCANSGTWTQGWIAFEDTNGNSVRENQEQLIVRVPALSRSLRFVDRMDSVRALAFGPGGALQSASAGKVGVFTICSNASESEARQITLQAGPALQVHQTLASACA